jgi:hypothetical protein
MSFNHPKAGPNFVPAYQLSGIPYVTSSISNTEVPNAGGGAAVGPIKISFPYVSKLLTVRNTGANDLRVAFSFTGSYDPGATVKGGGAVPATNSFGRNYFLVPAGAAGKDSIQTFDIRCKEVFLFGNGGTTGFSLMAGLTTIKADQFPILTGSVNGSTGFEGIG